MPSIIAHTRQKKILQFYFFTVDGNIFEKLKFLVETTLMDRVLFFSTLLLIKQFLNAGTGEVCAI